MARRTLLIAVLLGVQLISCAARLPALEEVNEVVLQLRGYRSWAWALGIGAICADLVLPVPQTAVIAALGILYGTVIGGLLGSVGLIAGGLLGYALARRYGRGPVARLVGDRSLARVESLFDRAGVWAIVLTRSLPFSIPEAVVCAAGLGGMQASKLLVALSLGSLPTAFVFSAIGAGWEEQPALALALGYALPIPLVPLVLYLMRGRAPARAPAAESQDVARRAPRVWWLVPCALIAACAYVLIVPPAVPIRSSYVLDLARVRALALRSGALPLRINVASVAESSEPMIGVLGELRTDRYAMAWTVFQIVFEDGSWVVDSAADEDLHRARAPGGRFDAERFASVQAALRESTGILFTHEHPDHLAGALRSVHFETIRKRMLVTPEQLASLSLRNDWGAPQDRLERLAMLSYDGIHRVAPGLVVIEAPGHTAGSQLVYVRLASDAEFLLVGDVAWHGAHVAEPRGHPRLSAWLLGEDLPAVLAQLRTLHEIARREGVIVLPSHDGALLRSHVQAGRLGGNFE